MPALNTAVQPSDDCAMAPRALSPAPVVRGLCQRLVLLSLFASSVALPAEAAGVPIAPRPGGMPVVAADWWNDVIGFVGDNDDDYRSQQMAVYGRVPWPGPWSLTGGFDHSILTERGPRKYADDGDEVEGRLDQLTISVGALWSIDHDGGLLVPDGAAQEHVQADRWQETRAVDASGHLAAGLSLRFHGRIGGETLQNQWHEVIDSPQVHLDWEANRTTAVGLWGSASYATRKQFDDNSWLNTWGLWTSAAGQIFSDGQAELGGRATAYIQGVHLGIWAGLRGELRGGYDDGLVLRAVAAAEEGVYGILGVRLSRWMIVETGVHLGSERRYGRVGFISDEGYLPRSPDYWHDHYRTSLRLAGLVPDYHLDAQLRVAHPSWSVGIWQVAAAVGVRRGQAPTSDPDDAYASGDQVSVGIDHSWSDGRDQDAAAVVPFLTTSVGWREEYLSSERSSRIAGSDTSTAVAVVDAGLRIGQPEAFKLTALFTIGVSAWYPFRQAEIRWRTQTVELLRPGVGILLGMDVQYVF